MREEHVQIGQLVRQYRTKKDMTQLELAELLGYETTQFVSLFERGLSKIPLATIGELIVILGIPEKKVMDTLVKAYANNLKGEIAQGKLEAKKKLN